MKALKYFNLPEGYFEVTSTSGTINGDYVYQYKDHLDNIRLSYKKSGSNTVIVSEKNYYPFGLKHKGYNSTSSSHLAEKKGFISAELQEENNLNWYDVTARNYDPALGRWMNLDPLAEKMRRHSPYNFAFNNPIYFTDPDGMEPQGANDQDKKRYTQKTETKYTYWGPTPDGGSHNISHTVTQSVSTYNEDASEVSVETTTTTYSVSMTSMRDSNGDTKIYTVSQKTVSTSSQKFENKRTISKDGTISDTQGKALSREEKGFSGKTKTLSLDNQHSSISGYAKTLKSELQENRKFNVFSGDVTTNTALAGGGLLATTVASLSKKLPKQYKLALGLGVGIGNILRNTLSHAGRTQTLAPSTHKTFLK